MTIAYKTKPNINGNCKRLVVNHTTKKYSYEEYWSDIDLVVKADIPDELCAAIDEFFKTLYEC